MTMRAWWIMAIASLVLVGTPALATENDPTLQALRGELAFFVGQDDEAITSLLAHLDTLASEMAPRLARVHAADEEQVRWLLRDRVLDNLGHKRALEGPDGETFPLTADEIRRTVIGYEAYKIEAYVTAGVFPKRYFGYLDGKWDTATHEVTLVETTHTCTEVINAWLAESSYEFRVTAAR